MWTDCDGFIIARGKSILLFTGLGLILYLVYWIGISGRMKEKRELILMAEAIRNAACSLICIGITVQAYITKYHYNCTNEILKGLGEMYMADERFTKNMDKYGVGTTKFMSDAIKVYCDKH